MFYERSTEVEEEEEEKEQEQEKEREKEEEEGVEKEEEEGEEKEEEEKEEDIKKLSQTDSTVREAKEEKVKANINHFVKYLSSPTDINIFTIIYYKYLHV